MVGSDHFHQLWLDNMPQFLVGKAPIVRRQLVQRGTRVRPAADAHARATRTCPAYILREGLDAGFDLAFSNELRIDHSITCPIITLRPQNDLPIVPIYTNIFAPPLPRPKRFVQLGQTIRRAGRVVAVGPAGRGDRHRAPVAGAGRAAPVRPARPRPGVRPQGRGVDRHRRPRGLPAPRSPWTACTRPGNATHGFMDFMLMMGVAGEGAKADYVDTYDLFHTMEAYFTWYPNGGARREQVPAEQVPVHRRPRPRAGRALPRATRAGTVAWWEAEEANRILNCHGGRGEHLAALRRRGARGAGHATTTRSCSSWARTRSSR